MQRMRVNATILLVVLTCAARLGAQTLPSGVINVPPTVIGDNQSIGSDTTLNVFDGGVVGDGFQAGLGDGSSNNIEVNISGGEIGTSFLLGKNSIANISGGTIDRGFRADQGSIVNVSGGEIKDVITLSGSTANISGGDVGGDLKAFSSMINISGGNVQHGFQAESGNTVNISGGSVGSAFTSTLFNTINLSGGSVGNLFELRGTNTLNISGGTIGTRFSANEGSMIDIVGSDFYLDGVLIDLEPDVKTLLPDRDVQLSGVLADGTPFEFDLFSTRIRGEDFVADSAVLTLTLVPEPSTIALCLLAAIAGRRRAQRFVRPAHR